MNNIYQKHNQKKQNNSNIDWTIFQIRTKIIKAIRTFFESHNFLEVDIPLLTPYPTLDSNIHPMETYFTDQNRKCRTLFLHTSPEHAMKKLLAAGAERIFFLGKVFRNRELTRLHNPEFTMVEWYRTHATYKDIQKDAEDLIFFIAQEVFSNHQLTYQSNKIDLTPPWKQITLSNLFKEKAGINLQKANTTESLKKAASSCGIRFQIKDDWETIFFRIFLERIEPNLGFPIPTFVTDYPLRMALMARRKTSDPGWVERVELYIAGLELANGYTELTDPEEQKKRFEIELKKKSDEGYKNYRIDNELLNAMKSGMPPCAGIALGVDRLVMFFTDKNDIQDVLFFPFHKMYLSQTKESST